MSPVRPSRIPHVHVHRRKARGLALLTGLTLFLGTGTGTGSASAEETAPAPTATVLTPLNQAVTPALVRLTAKVTAGSTALSGISVEFWGKRPGGSWQRWRVQPTNSSGYAGYTVQLDRTWYVLARFPGNAAHARSDSKVGVISPKPFGRRVIEEAARHQGKPYQWAAAGPYRFDCSGFTTYVFGRFGKRLPHNSGQQYATVRRIANGSKQIGDLIFTFSGGRVSHVGIYAGMSSGVGYMWASPRTGSYVKRQRIWSTYAVGRVA